MKVIGKKSISQVLKIALQLIGILGCLIFLFLPWVLQEYIRIVHIGMDSVTYYAQLILLYVSGVPALVIIYQFIKLFDSLEKETPFIKENAKHLKIASYSSFLISIEYLVGLMAFTSVFAIIISAVFMIAGLGLAILSELFVQAVNYKEENDLTI